MINRAFRSEGPQRSGGGSKSKRILCVACDTLNYCVHGCTQFIIKIVLRTCATLTICGAWYTAYVSRDRYNFSKLHPPLYQIAIEEIEIA